MHFLYCPASHVLQKLHVPRRVQKGVTDEMLSSGKVNILGRAVKNKPNKLLRAGEEQPQQKYGESSLYPPGTYVPNCKCIVTDFINSYLKTDYIFLCKFKMATDFMTSNIHSFINGMFSKFVQFTALREEHSKMWKYIALGSFAELEKTIKYHKAIQQKYHESFFWTWLEKVHRSEKKTLVLGGFQLEFVSLSRVIDHRICYKFECLHWLKLKGSDWRTNLVKDFF